MTRSSATEKVVKKQTEVIKEATSDKNMNQALDLMQDVDRATIQKMTDDKIKKTIQDSGE